MRLKNHVAFLVPVVALLMLFGGVANARGAGLHQRVIAHSQEEVDKALSLGCQVARQVRSLTALRCTAESAQVLGLTQDVRVMALESNIPFAPNRFGAQSATANNQIGASAVHIAGNTGAGKKIVVLDTGYNYNHPELASSYLGGKDFVNNDSDPLDDEGHGSHVSGIITSDGLSPSAKGVAPAAGVIAGKVLDESGDGYFSDVVAGIYWAVDGPDGVYNTLDDFDVDAINLSLGTSSPYTYKGFCNGALPDLTTAILYAAQKDVAVVVAAGNSGNSGVSIPGCISYSTTVGAVDGRDRAASFSGRGVGVDIVAPGVGVYSTVLGNGYASWNGTSMATPMVSGVVALMKYAHPTYTQPQVESKLFSSAKDLGKMGKDNNFGWGRVEAAKAVQ